jgi:DNA ligase 1
MLLQKSVLPFDDDSNITELKLDGIRLIISKLDNKVRLYTRQYNEVTSKFPALHGIDVPNGRILVEKSMLTIMKGKPDFETMMSRFQFSRYTQDHNLSYVVFDVIQYKGKSDTNLPKQLLDEIITWDRGTLSPCPLNCMRSCYPSMLRMLQLSRSHFP